MANTTGIWPNVSRNGQPVELRDITGQGYCSCGSRNGRCYGWASVETGIVREIVHNCENEEEAISRTKKIVNITREN